MDVRACRLIPARAGNTFLISFLLVWDSAHPRSRGEHPNHQRDKQLSLGSSPLARGTRNSSARHRHRDRLIPARAGNTHSWRAQRLCLAAHPRSRGEHGGFEAVASCVIGSSPLARGTPKDAIDAISSARLIPARAGNTTQCWNTTNAKSAHPRSRGEHCLPPPACRIKEAHPRSRGEHS